MYRAHQLTTDAAEKANTLAERYQDVLYQIGKTLQATRRDVPRDVRGARRINTERSAARVALIDLAQQILGLWTDDNADRHYSPEHYAGREYTFTLIDKHSPYDTYGPEVD
jgi:hypothetical protein